MYSNPNDYLYDIFISALYDVREGVLEAKHATYTQEALATELGSRWLDIDLQELIKDGFAIVSADKIILTAKGESNLGFIGIPVKPTQSAVGEQLLLVGELEKIVDIEKIRVLPVVHPSIPNEKGVALESSAIGLQESKKHIKDLAEAAYLVRQVGGYGIIFIPAGGTFFAQTSAAVYVLADASKLPRKDLSVEEILALLEGKTVTLDSK